ncbi:histidinol-phosphate aminotransferase family protein [Candidatus Daviesbacteria bacterium]|nr:histidinol-phosphate aminotransferase family protein [Candidatus Daviesbacteria bacterium]
MKLNTITNKYLKIRVTGYLSKDQKFDDLSKYLRLDLGENLLGSVNIETVLKAIDKKILAYYTDPSNSKIKKIIASLYNLSMNNVTIANSSNEIIDYLPRMIVDKNSKSIIVVPSFYRFSEASLLMQGGVIYLNLPANNCFKPDSILIDRICNSANKNNASIIWICNPNNPTGEVYEQEQIERIVKNSPSLVIVDEAFFEFYDPKHKKSAIKLIHKYENLIVLRTLSKAYGLAGLRFGYALAHSKMIEVIENYRDTMLMTSGLIINLAGAALMDQTFIQRTTLETRRLRENLFREISKLKNLELGADTKTNIYLLKHRTKDLYEELLKKGILTADFRKSKGIENMGFVRITIADEEKNKKFLTSLKEIN